MIQLLTDFIAIKWQNHKKDDNDLQDDLEANINIRNDDIVLLWKDMIDQITDPNVTKIRETPCKKRMKSAIEISKKRCYGGYK